MSKFKIRVTRAKFWESVFEVEADCVAVAESVAEDLMEAKKANGHLTDENLDEDVIYSNGVYNEEDEG